MQSGPTLHIQVRSGNNVRIGPITVITLIIVVCMAVMGVLAASTARATQTISQRQADATRYLYLDEMAGQEFVASIDDALSYAHDTNASAAFGAASVDGTRVAAEFICENMRQLNVAVTIQDAGTYRIDEWKMTSAQGDAQVTGNLWTGE